MSSLLLKHPIDESNIIGFIANQANFNSALAQRIIDRLQMPSLATTDGRCNGTSC